MTCSVPHSQPDARPQPMEGAPVRPEGERECPLKELLAISVLTKYV
jgi:hypothetical protein